MRTVAETPVFIRYANEVWSEAERQEFHHLHCVEPRGWQRDLWQRWLPEGAMVTYWHW